VLFCCEITAKESSMKAIVYYGQYDVRVEEVPDPRLEAPRGAIVKVTYTAIYGSDLHLYDGCPSERSILPSSFPQGRARRRSEMYDIFKKQDDGRITVVPTVEQER
jgi:hypothetical protein